MQPQLLLLIGLLILLNSNAVCACFATSPSKGRGNGGGFGAAAGKKNSKGAYKVDTTAAVKKLVDVLLTDCECEGMEPDDGGVEIGFGGDGDMRGVFAKESLGEGEFVVAIPFPSTVVVSMEEDDSITDAGRGLSFLKEHLLDHYSSADKQQDGEWPHPYLHCLPRNDYCFDPTPDFWSEEEIRALEFPRIVKEALDRKEQIQTLSEKEGVDVDQLQFATWLVKSRCFTILKVKPNDGDNQKVQTKSVMIPFFDMLNHNSDQPNAKLQVIETKVEDESFYAVQATKAIPAGKEITISYGTTCDSSVELLMNYGLVQNANQFDAEMLRQGGDDCFNRIDEWTTTLEEDEEEFKGAVGNRRTILAFRSRLKQAIQDM